MWKRTLLALVVSWLLALSVVGAQPAVIQTALADLNTRLGTALTLDQLDNWSWSQEMFNDASLGCPQPDQVYAQVVTRGYTFIFTYAGMIYDYRADEQGNVFFCSSSTGPATPIPPTPTMIVRTPTGALITPATAEDVAELERITTEPGTLGGALTWTATGGLIAVAAGSSVDAPTAGAVLLYNALDLTAEPERVELNSPVMTLTSAVLEGRPYIVAGTLEGIVVQFPVAPTGDDALVMTPLEGVASVNQVAVSPDFGYIAAAYGDLFAPVVAGSNLAAVWDASMGAPLRSFEHEYPVGAVAFSNDSATLATGDAQGFVRLWDISAGTMIAEYRLHAEAIRALAFSPDGLLIASGSMDGSAQIVEIADGSLIGTFDNTTDDAVLTLAFTMDGTLLATGGGNPNAVTRDNSIRLWNIATLEVVGGLLGHDAAVGSFAFSPDGTRIISVGDDDTLRMWGAADDGAG